MRRPMNPPAHPAAATDTAPRDVSRWRMADVELDEATLELRRGGNLVSIERKPLELLMWLLRHPGEVITKEELLDALWADRVVTESVLTKCVAKLRQAIGDHSQAVLKTVHGFGYRLVAPVERLAMLTEPPPAGPATMQAGDTPPQRPNWQLVSRFEGARGENWLARHAKSGEQRVFKFALDAAGMAQLKREITLHRLLRDTLGPRDDFVQVIDWNLREPPYFVELAHCSQGSLRDWLARMAGGAAAVPLATRLELVAQTADALAAAHSAGVLHKDIKPANVLIELDASGAPRVRLGDFGSGRVLDADRLQAMDITRMGFTQTLAADTSTSGTWAYLAPEVVAGQAPTVRSDIFALGVLLYQLAVGDLKRPLAPGWERELDDELLREDVAACCDQEPARRLGDAAELGRRLRALPERHAARQTEQRAAAEAALVRQALQRSRARRGWLLALSGVSMAAALGTGLLYLQVRDARDEAERQAAAATSVSDFLVKDLIAAADPLVSGSRDTSVRTVLQQAQGRIDDRFAKQPAVAAEVRLALARSLHGTGQHEAAILELALVARSEAATAQTRAAAWLAAADANIALSQHAAAAQALEAAAGLLPNTGSRRAEMKFEHDVIAAGLLRLQGEAKASVAALQLLRARADGSKPISESATIPLLGHLGAAQLETGDLEGGVATLRDMLERVERDAGAGHPRTLAALHELGQALRLVGRIDESEVLFRRGYALAVQAYGPDALMSIALGGGVADALLMSQRTAEARELLRTLHTRAKARFGAEHAMSQSILNSLAMAVGDSGDRDTEQVLYRELLEVQRRVIGSTHPDTLTTLHNLGRSHLRARQPRLGLPYSSEAHAGAMSTLGEEHYAVNMFCLGRAHLLLDLGQRDEARALATPCAEQVSKQLGPEHANTRSAQALMARL